MFSKSTPDLFSIGNFLASTIPLVVIPKCCNPGMAPSSEANSMKSFRTVGSPPVSLIFSTPSETNSFASRKISSEVSRLFFGVSSTPSSGMQYKQRRLHLSVTEMRRYVCFLLRSAVGTEFAVSKSLEWTQRSACSDFRIRTRKCRLGPLPVLYSTHSFPSSRFVSIVPRPLLAFCSIPSLSLVPFLPTFSDTHRFRRVCPWLDATCGEPRIGAVSFLFSSFSLVQSRSTCLHTSHGSLPPRFHRTTTARDVVRHQFRRHLAHVGRASPPL
mmetsp:Transcript_2288/g.15219  ORF Transcript_2288/g.15219 Transcript_2288/m.15219 type:complete len:271 (-) Transcript_2288:35-847(-)